MLADILQQFWLSILPKTPCCSLDLQYEFMECLCPNNLLVLEHQYSLNLCYNAQIQTAAGKVWLSSQAGILQALYDSIEYDDWLQLTGHIRQHARDVRQLSLINQGGNSEEETGLSVSTFSLSDCRGAFLSSSKASRWPFSKWSALWQSPVFVSVTMKSVNLSTCPDALRTTSGVTAGHSTCMAPSMSSQPTVI